MTVTEYSGIELAARNRDLEGALTALQQRNARKYDAVVPVQAIESRSGLLHIAGMGPDGPSGEPGLFTPGEIMLGHLAERMNVPVKYIRWMHANRPDLFDVNLNGLIHGQTGGREAAIVAAAAEHPNVPVYAPDDRTMLVRSLTGDDGVGYGRALLSDRYASYDDLDMLLALLEGIKSAGVENPQFRFDLSERRMVVKVSAPELSIAAPELIEGYRTPWGDGGRATYGHRDLIPPGSKVGDVVAGLLATNSETGGSAWQIAPYALVVKCTNGLALMKQAMRTVHLGSKLEAGEVRWSEDTEEKNIATVTAKTRDAVTAFLSTEFLQTAVDGITEKAVKPIENPAAMVELVANRMAYTEEQSAGILDHFIKGGQMTCGGILQAVTSFAQEIENPDTAFDFETSAIEALEVAFANA